MRLIIQLKKKNVMRMILLASVLMCLFSNCENKAEENVFDKIRKEKEDIAMNIPDSLFIDTIFLGFRFSMTEDDLLKHYKNLIKTGKVNKDANYEFNFPHSTAIGEISPLYYQDTLVKIFVQVYGDGLSMPLHLHSLVDEKYSGYLVDIEKSIVGTGVTATYIKRNLEVFVSPSVKSDAILTYTNIPRYKRMEAENAAKASLKQKENKEDL